MNTQETLQQNQGYSRLSEDEIFVGHKWGAFTSINPASTAGELIIFYTDFEPDNNWLKAIQIGNETYGSTENTKEMARVRLNDAGVFFMAQLIMEDNNPDIRKFSRFVGKVGGENIDIGTSHGRDFYIDINQTVKFRGVQTEKDPDSQTDYINGFAFEKVHSS